ncbi:hypothetical protein K466DRAFT_606722, partial [Polyporus arcularius HHB13444]
FEIVDSHERLFVVGTTLATFSAFRLVKHAIEKRKPVMLLNVGPTRQLLGVETIEIPAGTVMRDVVKAVLGNEAEKNTVIAEMLKSGVVKRPPDDHDDPMPRPAGL